MFKALFGKDPALEAGQALYAAAVEQARAVPLYEQYGVPDTVEGRFDMVMLHVYLLMRRLRVSEQADGVGAGQQKVSQCLFDTMFENMDDQLRELGVGLDAVGKKIRNMAENFYGRIGAYEDALASSAPEDALAKTLGRNIFGDENAPKARAIAVYVRGVDGALMDQPQARITGGIVLFPGVEQNK